MQRTRTGSFYLFIYETLEMKYNYHRYRTNRVSCKLFFLLIYLTAYSVISVYIIPSSSKAQTDKQLWFLTNKVRNNQLASDGMFKKQTCCIIYRRQKRIQHPCLTLHLKYMRPHQNSHREIRRHQA